MQRQEMLEEAIKTVCGHRVQDYGTPEDNFSRIAELWTSYISNVANMQLELEAIDVANMMILFKMARVMAGGTTDSYVDIAGYAACACEILNEK